jgi:methyl-accepting chemotaxis protein
VQQVNTSVQRVNSSVQQVNTTVQQFNQVIQTNASASEELASTSEELLSQAEELKSKLSYFQVDVSESLGHGTIRKQRKKSPPVHVVSVRQNNGMIKEHRTQVPHTKKEESSNDNKSGFAIDMMDEEDNNFQRL